MTPDDEAQRRRLWQIGAAGVSVLIVAVAIALIAGGGSNRRSGPLQDVAETRALFAGIPQDGIALGDPSAPVTLTEFADLQCPFCAQVARDVLPELVERYVRPGRLRIVFRNLAFLGDDSERGARAAAAAALQDRLWPFVDVFFRNQGFENTGYATDAFLRRVARAAQVPDVAAMMAQRDSPAADRQLDQAKAQAERFDLSSTPSFLLGRTGQPPRRLDVDRLEADAFTGPIDELLGAG